MVTSDFRPEVEIRLFRACAMKNTQYNAYLWPNRRNYRVLKETGSRNTMVTSDFRPVLEKRPFRACAMKNTQYNAYLWPNGRNLRILKEIGVEEHEGDVRFLTGSGNIALSFMRHASGHNRSLIVDVAMGQIPRSTERISSISILSFLPVVYCWRYTD